MLMICAQKASKRILLVRKTKILPLIAARRKASKIELVKAILYYNAF
jgi:hypothetical protein